MLKKPLIFDENRRLTPVVQLLLSRIARINISQLKNVKIKSSKENFFCAPWYSKKKGGGAITIGQTIYLTQNYFLDKNNSTESLKRFYHGGNDEFSTLKWLQILAHEVGHLPQATAFGLTKRGKLAYISYFSKEYFIRFITFKSSIHDGVAAEITADLGRVVFNCIFLSEEKKTISKSGKILLKAVMENNLKLLEKHLQEIEMKIDEIASNYIKKHCDKFLKMEKTFS